MIGALFVAALALYWGSLRNPPVFDDSILSERFLRRYSASWFKLDLRWFSYVTFGWIHEAFGRDWLWQRVANVLLHSTVASILFLFLRRLLGAVVPADRAWSAWYAFFGAFFFLAHPAAVYGVAYLVQRSIVMATLFGLLSLWLFLEGLLRGGRAWFIASTAAYFAAVFAKEHAVMLPAVAAAIAWLLRGRSWRDLPALARELALPMVLYGLVAVLVTLKLKGLLGVQYEMRAEIVLRDVADAAQGAVHADSWLLSVLNQGFLYFRYLLTWLLPWPGMMSIDVRTAFPVNVLSWPQTAGFLAWLSWPVLSLVLLARGGRTGLAGFAMLSPWLLACTEFSTVRVQEPFVLYRSYLWMCLLPAAVPALLQGLRQRWRAALMIAVCLALLPPFFDRLASFASEIRVWDDAVKRLDASNPPYASRTVRNRGSAYFKAERFEEALRDFDRALEIDPRSAASWIARGSLYMRTAQNEKALADFDRAQAIDSRYKMVPARRCLVLARLGRMDEALAECVKAVEVDAGAANSFITLGMVRAHRGEVAQAESAYQRALELDPTYGMALYQYGLLLNSTGRAAEARRLLAAACAERVPDACRDARALGVPP